MKKLYKGLIAAVLSVGFLASCNAKTHLVEFYADNVGTFFKEVEVKHNKTVANPGEPDARKDYDWAGWWVDASYSKEFDFTTKIVEDTKVYGKWDFNPAYEPDDRTFHLVGGLENTELSYVNWNDAGIEGEDWDVRSYLTRAEDSNLYSIEVEVGYLGKFKVKVPGRPWDSDTEFNYLDIREADLKEYLKEGDSKNIQVKTAGLYRIEVETTWGWARVTRLGDAKGEGVTPDADPDAILNWGIVGGGNNWGNPDENEVVTPDLALTYNEEGKYYFLPIVHFVEGHEFKLRVDNKWGTEFGSHEDNVIDEVGFKQATELVDEVETIKQGGNITVLVGGYYSVYFDGEALMIRALEFALRGDALATGWGEDSAALELVGEPVVDEVEGTVTYTYAGEYEVGAGEVKVKFAEMGKFSGWDFSYGPEDSDNFKVTAGTITVGLVVVLDVEALTFTGTATVAAK